MYDAATRGVYLSLGLAVGALVAAPAAEGQEPQPPQQTIEVDDQALEQFAEAYLDVQEINQELEAELQQVGDDPQKAQQLQQEYSAQMTQAVRDRDLEVQEYRNIINAINADEELRGRFIETLQEVQEEREPRP